MRTEGSVTTSQASVGVEEAGLVPTVLSAVPLAGLARVVSTSVSVTMRPPAVQWTGSVSVSRALRATGKVSQGLETTRPCGQKNFKDLFLILGE